MKILLISTQDYIHHPVPSRHHYIFEELAKNHEIHVPHFHVSRGKERPTRLQVHEATVFGIQNPMLHYTLNAPYHFYKIPQICEEYDIDVIVAAHILAGTAAIRAARKNKIPVIFDVKDWYPEGAAAYYKNPMVKKSIQSIVWHITKYNLANSDEIVTVSPSLVKLLDAYGFESRLITNGVDTSLFKPFDASKHRLDLGISPADFVIGYVGSLERFFDIHSLIEMIPELLEYHSNIKFLVVGSSLFTDYERELHDLVKINNLEKHVIFTGGKPYSELPSFINTMDVCMIPMRMEWAKTALPNKFFEYSACGKPIISTPIPDIAELNQGNVVFYRDRDECISHLLRFIETPGMKAEMCANVAMDEFSWVNKAKEFENLLQRFVHQS